MKDADVETQLKCPLGILAAGENMAGKLPMGQKELLRAKVIDQVVQNQISLKDAAIKVKVSYRQVKRIYKVFPEQGDKSLIHGNQGKPSGRSKGQEIRKQAIALYQEHYSDFGPTLALENWYSLMGVTMIGLKAVEQNAV